MFDAWEKIKKDRKCLEHDCMCTPIIVGPTGPTAQLFKSSNNIIIDSS